MLRTKQALCQEILDDADAWAKQLYDNQYVGDYLAKHGYVVFSADAPMWGERGRKEGVDRNKYDLIAGNMMMLGRDLSAFMTYDDISSTEFLASLPMVDAKRIGCVGCSMGAYRSWMLSALSDRIKAGASICWMITTDAQLTRRFGRKENGGFANCIPALRQYLDYPAHRLPRLSEADALHQWHKRQALPRARCRRCFRRNAQGLEESGSR